MGGEGAVSALRVLARNGQEMFSKPFKNGKSYEDCFPNKGIGIRQNYPYFDEKEGKVITLELALNRCREAMASRRSPM